LHGSSRLNQAKRCVGGQQASSGPFEENQAELRLQLSHMPTYGGLARLQLASGGKKASMLNNCEEGAHERPIKNGIHKCNSEM
jgi:hypothetical protein